MTRPQLASALASLQRGVVLETSADRDMAGQLEELAATLPEIYGTADIGCLERIAARLGIEAAGASLAEVVLLSETRIHVVVPLVQRPGQALLAVGPAARSVGLVLSQAHAQAAQWEVEK